MHRHSDVIICAKTVRTCFFITHRAPVFVLFCQVSVRQKWRLWTEFDCLLHLKMLLSLSLLFSLSDCFRLVSDDFERWRGKSVIRCSMHLCSLMTPSHFDDLSIGSLSLWLELQLNVHRFLNIFDRFAACLSYLSFLHDSSNKVNK